MKSKTLYTCEICNTDYANKSDAQKCEKEHTVSTVIKDFRYQAHIKYPNKVLIKFTDGVERWYKE